MYPLARASSQPCCIHCQGHHFSPVVSTSKGIISALLRWTSFLFAVSLLNLVWLLQRPLRRWIHNLEAASTSWVDHEAGRVSVHFVGGARSGPLSSSIFQNVFSDFLILYPASMRIIAGAALSCFNLPVLSSSGFVIKFILKKYENHCWIHFSLFFSMFHIVMQRKCRVDPKPRPETSAQTKCYIRQGRRH